MNTATTLVMARARAGLSLRQLARRAGTSHSTIAAYEAGRKVPSVETFDRIVKASGLTLHIELSPGLGDIDPVERGHELEAVLELAAQFPARHAATLEMPVFGRR